MIIKCLLTIFFFFLANLYILGQYDDYQVPKFNQVEYDEKDGVSFQKIVQNHYANRDDALINFELLVGEAKMYQDDREREKEELEKEEQQSSNNSVEATDEKRPGQKSLLSIQVSQDNGKIPFAEDASNLSYFMNSEQYDQNGGVKADILVTIKD